MNKKTHKISNYFGKYLIFALIGPLATCLDVVCEILIPLIGGRMIDTGVQNHDVSYIKQMGIYVVILALLALCFGVTNIFCSAKAALGLGSNLRSGIFKKVQEFSFHNIDQFGTASLITRTTSDVNLIQLAVMFSLRMLVRGPLLLIFSIIMAFSINAELALILIIAIPVMAIAIGMVMYRAYPLFQATQQKVDVLNSTVQENLIGIRTVKAYVRKDFEEEKFESANTDLMTNSYKASILLSWVLPILILVIYIAESVSIWVGGHSIAAGQMGAGTLGTFLGYITQVMIALTLIAQALIFIARSRAASKRVSEVLNTQVDIQSAPNALASPTLAPQVTAGAVEYRNVSFRYDNHEEGFVHVSSEAREENVLQDINFTVNAGEMVAIVGATGSSKSTLINLLPRFYDVSEGTVLVDNHDVRDYILEDLRNGIGMVLQKNVLFEGTIKENIRWGKPDATDEEITQACEYAQAAGFIADFHDGYDHWIDQGGVNVSGGQRQRLCIARALVKNPKILILDDSTSAVDTITDAKIRDAFRNKLNMTVILIAQRITSVQDADKIIVMDEGRIDAIGTHDELLKTNAIYHEIYELQQGGGDE